MTIHAGHEALWVTLLGIAAVSLRYLPVSCPPVVLVLRTIWAEIYLLGLTGFLIRETSKVPAELASPLPWFGWPAWVHIPAHAAVWFSVLLTARHLLQFRIHRPHAPELVDLTADILLLPPTFGILAVRCLRILPERGDQDLWDATSTLDAAELWESWALWSFQKLFIRYAQASNESNLLFVHLKRLCQAGVQQYLVFNVATNIFEFAARGVALFRPEVCELMWGGSSDCQDVFFRLQDHLVGAMWYSCSVAIFCILRFEVSMSECLAPIRPFWKFWGAKLIVTVASIQRLVLFGLTAFSLFQEPFAWYAHAYLLCLEVCALSAIHFWAYPEHEFRSDGPLSPEKMKRACVDPPPTAYGKLDEDSTDSPMDSIELPELPVEPSPDLLPEAAISAKTCGAERKRSVKPYIPKLPLPLPAEVDEDAGEEQGPRTPPINYNVDDDDFSDSCSNSEASVEV